MENILGTRIKKARNSIKPKISAKRLAEELGVNESSIGHWEVGRYKPKQEHLIKMASLFGVTTDYLLGRTDSPTDIIANISSKINGSSSMVTNLTDAVALPPHPSLLGQGITWSVDLVELLAGAGKVAFEETEIIGNMLLKFPEQVDFAMRVKGTSMEPEIKDGALLFVRALETGQDIRRGELIICSVLDTPGVPDWMVRRANVHRKKHYAEIILESNSGEVEAHPFDDEHIFCLGRVVDWVNDEGIISELLKKARNNS